MDDKIISALLSALIKKADESEGSAISKLAEGWEDTPGDKFFDKLTGVKEDSIEDKVMDAMGDKLMGESEEEDEEEEEEGDVSAILKLFKS